jgi:hypothetical protein
LNGRPNGRTAAEAIVTASAVIMCVTSMKSGSVRLPDTQPL